MNTVLLYKLTFIHKTEDSNNKVKKEKITENYSFTPWIPGGFYQGHDDGGVEYILPEGYYIGTDQYDEKVLRNKDGKRKAIRMKEGKPIFKDGTMIYILEEK